jgi:hypothetical protein
MIGGNESSGTPGTAPGVVKATPESVDSEAEARRARRLANAEMLAANAMARNCDERRDPATRANCETWKAAQLLEVAKLRMSLNTVMEQGTKAVKING